MAPVDLASLISTVSEDFKTVTPLLKLQVHTVHNLFGGQRDAPATSDLLPTGLLARNLCVCNSLNALLCCPCYRV